MAPARSDKESQGASERTRWTCSCIPGLICDAVQEHPFATQQSSDKINIVAKNDPPSSASKSPSGPAGGRVRRVLLEWIETDEHTQQALPASLTEALEAFAPGMRVRELNNQNDLPWPELRFLAVDTETSGLRRESDRIIEIAWVLFERGEIKKRSAQLLNVDFPLPQRIVELTGIRDDMLTGQPKMADILNPLLEDFSSVDFIVAYHAPFDRGFIEAELHRCNASLPPTPWVDPLVFIKELDRYKPGKKLADASSRWGIKHERAHRALDDAIATGELLLKVSPFLPMRSLDDLLSQQNHFRERQRNDKQPVRAPERPNTESPEPATLRPRLETKEPRRTNTKDFLFGKADK